MKGYESVTRRSLPGSMGARSAYTWRGFRKKPRTAVDPHEAYTGSMAGPSGLNGTSPQLWEGADGGLYLWGGNSRLDSSEAARGRCSGP